MILSEDSATPYAAVEMKSPVREPRPPRRVSRVLLDPGLLLWNAFLILASPFLLGLKIRRHRRGTSDHELNSERWTLHTDRQRLAPPEPGKRRVVFVAASFGEILLVDPLTRMLNARRPDVEVVWAVRDAHSLSELRRERPEQPTVIQPFDSMPPVLRWLKLVDPECVVYAERFSFPNLVVGSRLWGARLLLINGRAKKVEGFFRVIASGFYRWVFEQFDRLCFQSAGFAERALPFVSADRVTVLGNLKLDLPRRTLDPRRASELQSWLQPATEVPLLIAGSTNEIVEERFVLDAFLETREKTPCRLLLAPRKLQRIPDVCRLLEQMGLSVSLRSQGGPPADVMLLDTMGELAFAYGYGKAAYVGGSLHGKGHNIVEPLEYGIPVAYGPRRGHFEELQKLCEGAGVGFRIHAVGDLSSHWERVILDPEFAPDVKRRTTSLMEAQKGSVDATYEMITRALDANR